MAKTLSEALFGDSEGIEERQSRALAKELRKPELAPSENTLQPGPLSFETFLALLYAVVLRS